VSESCIDPDAMREGDLMAYVDGIGRKAVAEQIHRCPACAREVGEFRVLQSMLAIRLYRYFCPEPDRLLAYGHGELEDEENLAVARHLDLCPHCVRELSTISDIRSTPRRLP
jgi:anti-sigma factor RsiW